jgi:hypothetical protein
VGRRTRADWPLHPVGEALFRELVPEDHWLCGTCGAVGPDFSADLHMNWHIRQVPS